MMQEGPSPRRPAPEGLPFFSPVRGTKSSIIIPETIAALPAAYPVPVADVTITSTSSYVVSFCPSGHPPPALPQGAQTPPAHQHADRRPARSPRDIAPVDSSRPAAPPVRRHQIALPVEFLNRPRGLASRCQIAQTRQEALPPLAAFRVPFVGRGAGDEKAGSHPALRRQVLGRGGPAAKPPEFQPSGARTLIAIPLGALRQLDQPTCLARPLYLG